MLTAVTGPRTSPFVRQTEMVASGCKLVVGGVKGATVTHLLLLAAFAVCVSCFDSLSCASWI